MRAWLRQRLLRTYIPGWLGFPLDLIAVVYLVAKPLGYADNWKVYAVSLAAAVLVAADVRRKFKSTTLVRSDESVKVFRIEYKTKSERGADKLPWL